MEAQIRIMFLYASVRSCGSDYTHLKQAAMHLGLYPSPAWEHACQRLLRHGTVAAVVADLEDV
jgi:hypothetical protein